MNIDSYIAARRPEWDRLSEVTRGGQRGLTRAGGAAIEEAVRLYLRSVADLAEVRTRFHDPHLEAYLNAIVSRAHGVIYGARAPATWRSLRGAGDRFRLAVRNTRAHMGAAAVVLFGTAALVFVWVLRSREARAGLVPGFAEEAVRRAGGSAFGGAPRGAISTFIFFNNVQVALLAFGLGITLCIGTIYVLITNGILIGALAGAYTSVGYAGSFWTLVLPHGFLELTAIVFAAGAGMRMGWSVIAPGDLSRSDALAAAARDAAIVVVGTIPAFLVAAGIEGFFTTSDLPGAFKIAVGGLVALAYLVWVFGRRPSTADRTP